VTAIRESLINTLIGIYHQRISYPGFNPPSEARSQNAGQSQTKELETCSPAPRESGPEKTTPGQPETLPQHVHAQSPR
jgi:hypothetical protein